MKKVIIGLTVALLALGAAGCSKDKKSSNTAAAAPAPVEQLAQLEAMYQLDDTKAADPSKALSCKYIFVSGSNGAYEVKRAEIQTAGKCDFNALKGQAAGAGPLSAAAAAQIVDAIAADSSLPASARDKRNCVAYNIKTSKRKAGLQDCKDNSGNGDAIAKTLSNLLGLK